MLFWIERRRAPKRPSRANLTVQSPVIWEIFIVHHIALPLQKNLNAPIAEPPAFVTNCLHPLPKIAIVGAVDSYSNPHSPDDGRFCRKNLMLLHNYQYVAVSRWCRLDSIESVYSFVMEDK